MKTSKLVCTLGILSLVNVSGAVRAETDIEAAKNSCEEEAISTGLVDEADIAAYVELCMQAWQDPIEYLAPNSPPEETSDPSQN